MTISHSQIPALIEHSYKDLHVLSSLLLEFVDEVLRWRLPISEAMWHFLGHKVGHLVAPNRANDAV